VSLRELLFAGLLLAAFAPGLAALAQAWSSAEYQSHGFLVPFVSGLIAHRIATLHARLARRPDRRGALLLAAAIVLYGLGVAAGSAPMQGLAFPLAVAGGVWLLRGLAWLRALAFPIAFLIFMVPIPPDWLAPVVVRLLLFVSAAAEGVLATIGVPVVREGNVLQLPAGESLFVAEACSGLTSLVTLTPIAVLIAWLSPLSRGARVLLVALVVPVAMAANLIRVIGTVLGARAWGVSAVTGEPVHTLVGLAVYAAGTLALLAVARGLSTARPAPAR
jgi:exosortase